MSKRERTVAERMADLMPPPDDDEYARWRKSAKGQYYFRQLEQNAYKKGFTGYREKAPPSSAPILANPQGKGYGYAEIWPFDPKRAFQHLGYRAGIERALHNSSFANNWKYQAKLWLEDIYEYERQLRETYADIIAEELQASFTAEEIFSEPSEEEN